MSAVDGWIVMDRRFVECDEWMEGRRKKDDGARGDAYIGRGGGAGQVAGFVALGLWRKPDLEHASRCMWRLEDSHAVV
jgi:hypothetical protein